MKDKIKDIIIIALLPVIVATVLISYCIWTSTLSISMTRVANWEKGWAVMDSITSYFNVNHRFPESWEEIKKTYTENGIYDGYGHDVSNIDKDLEVNFRFLTKINEQTELNMIQTEWILRLSSDGNGTLFQEHHDRFFEVLRVSLPRTFEKRFQPRNKH